MRMGLPLRSLARLANRRATSRRSGLTSCSIMVAPRTRRVLMASSTMTGPKDIPPAPIRQIFGPCSRVTNPPSFTDGRTDRTGAGRQAPPPGAGVGPTPPVWTYGAGGGSRETASTAARAALSVASSAALAMRARAGTRPGCFRR